MSHSQDCGRSTVGRATRGIRARSKNGLSVVRALIGAWKLSMSESHLRVRVYKKGEKGLFDKPISRVFPGTHAIANKDKDKHL